MATKPVLLLSPDGSYNENGITSPTLGTGIIVVPGEHGNAWRRVDGLGVITHPSSGYISEPEGTVIVRGSFEVDPANPDFQKYLFHTVVDSSNRIYLGRSPGPDKVPYSISGPNALSGGPVIPDNAPICLASRWGDESTMFLDGALVATDIRSGTIGPATNIMLLGSSYTRVESALFFDRALTDAEIAEWSTMNSAWTWGNTFGPHAGSVFPSYTSSVFSVSSEVFITDKFNRSRHDISNYITDLEVEGDNDRAASKMSCRVSAYKEVIKDGDWIAPYLTYTPETGDIARSQMGHFRIDGPSVRYDGTGSEITTGTGSDILELLEASTLTSTYYTPKRGDIVLDIYALLSMATRGWVEPNMVQNPSFEDHNDNIPTFWSNSGVFSSGGTGSITWFPTGYDVPSGDRVWGPVFDPSQPPGAVATIYQNINLKPGSIGKNFWLSGIWLPSHRDHRGWIRADFYDATGNLILNSSYQTDVKIRSPLRWNREHTWGVVPENAVTVRVTVAVKDEVGGFAGQRRSSWDDITFQLMSGKPIPADRMIIPEFSGQTDSRIQSTSGTSFLTAINDRLAAAGFTHLYTNHSGMITFRKAASERDTAIRQYSESDSRIMGEVDITRSTADRYNTVIAVKEDLANGQSIYEIAQNKNASDPWNIYGEMGVISRYITVQDAMTSSELAIAAREELNKASLQEELLLSVLPDQGISLHDTIEISTNDRRNGRWTIVGVRYGMKAENPLVELHGRRNIVSEG